MTKRNKLFFIISVICIIATFAPLINADNDPKYSGNEWALLDSTQVMASAATITNTNHRNCDEVVVDGKLIQIYHADGTAESQNEIFTKVLTEKGKRNNSLLNCSYMLPYGAVNVFALEVIKPDNTVIPVNVAANSEESINSQQMQSNIYDPNKRVLKVNIPGLEPGDVVHSIVRYITVRPFIPGEYFASFRFEGPAYIRHLSIEIQSPKEKPLKHIVLKNKVPKTVSSTTRPGQDGTMIYHWEIKNVPRMFDEPAMPSYSTVLQNLLVSTIPDWQTVSRWYWELSKPHLEAISPEMKMTVGQLTSGIMTDLEKIKTIFYYVSKQIRYMGVTPEQDRPGFEPHDVKLTFAKKYGVCRDKAALLVSMLRIAGMNAYPVLTNVGAKVDPEVPGVSFNHAIVAVELKTGDELLMDPTDETTMELLPPTEGNQSYLICRPAGADLKTTPVSPATKNMIWIKTAGMIEASGLLKAKSEITFEGLNDNLIRKMFARMEPDEIKSFFEKSLRSVISGAHVTEIHLTPANVLDVSSPVKADIVFTTDTTAVFGMNKTLINIPWISNILNTSNSVLKNASLTTRKYPMEAITCGIHEDISLNLSDNFTKILSIPSFTPVENDYLSYNCNLSFKDHLLECSREFQLKTVEFSPGEYLELKQFLKARDYYERKNPIFATAGPTNVKTVKTNYQTEKPSESDVRVLESQKQLLVKDAHTAILKVRYAIQILSYAGKKRESEVKIPYNPSIQKVKLVSATVTSQNGQKHKIDQGEIHVMDAGWNASAKRYTGGKILVANLPGVEIGSSIEVEYEITISGQPYIAGFEAFQFSEEMEQKTFKITAPSGIQVLHQLGGSNPNLHEEIKQTDVNQELVWRAEHITPMPAEDKLPPDWAFKSGVGYFIGDPQSYLKAVSQNMLNHASRSENSKKTALSITEHAKTKLDALKAIRDYIVKSIRLSGPSFTELPLTQLSDADTTLADGYGHQADRAILFYAMLQAAGFNPEFILASNLPPVPEIAKIAASFPLPDSFQIPLVRVKCDDETYYLNDTDQYACLGATPHNGKQAIVLPSLAYETIKVAEKYQNAITTDYSISLGVNGNAMITIKHQYFGMNFAEKNRFFKELKLKGNQLYPDEQYYQKAVSAIAQGARPMGNLKINFDAYPGVEEFTVEIDNYGVLDGRFFYFKLPFIPKFISTDTDGRALPLYIPEGAIRDIRVEIELPADYRQVEIAPKNDNFNGPGGKVQISSINDKGKIIITYQLNSQPAILAPGDYSVLQAFESTLENQASGMILLQSNGNR